MADGAADDGVDGAVGGAVDDAADDAVAGLDALDIAVIMPANEIAAFAALADEYGVPLMDETPKALSDTPLGSLLLNILELPEYPTASRLLAIPELSQLANEAFEPQRSWPRSPHQSSSRHRRV